MGPVARPSRPFGVVLLAVLALIGGVIGALTAALGVMAGVFDGETSALVGGLLAGVFALVSLAFAWGAWWLQPWAWPLGVILWTLALLDAVLLLAQGTINTNLVVAPLCLWYLFRPAVRAAFGD